MWSNYFTASVHFFLNFALLLTAATIFSFSLNILINSVAVGQYIRADDCSFTTEESESCVVCINVFYNRLPLRTLVYIIHILPNSIFHQLYFFPFVSLLSHVKKHGGLCFKYLTPLCQEWKFSFCHDFQIWKCHCSDLLTYCISRKCMEYIHSLADFCGIIKGINQMNK